MSWPQQQICRLSIYLTLLALCMIHATDVSTDATNTTPKPAENSENENYEVIDVGSQANGDGKQELHTGQTTRIFTTGDVDDDFWLKHLGEDFKYAIHLQVGDSDRYDGIYNMTEDGANYEIQHDYNIKEIPVDDGKESEKQNEAQTLTKTQAQNQNQNQQQNTQDTTPNTNTPNTENNTPTVDHKSVQADQNAQPADAEKVENTNENTQENTAKSTPDGNQFEQIFAIDDAENMSIMKNLQPIKKYTQKHGEKPKIQNISIKLTPKSKTEQNKNQQHEENDSTSPYQAATPIVVTLPHDEETVHQLADENTPVVVKMPPVIYHHNPNFGQLSPESYLNTATATHLHQNPNMSPQQQQHNQYTMPTHHNHQHSHQQHYENTDFTHYNSHATPQQLTPQLQQQQQQHQQSYYTPSLLGDATNYRRDSVFSAHDGATINAISNQASKEQLHKPRGSIRFILRKPSAPYNGPPARNQLPLENSF